MDLTEFFFTIGFIFIGSIVFHISTLISGYSIYREMESVESSFLSTAAGLVVFLLSPVSLVILTIPEKAPSNYLLTNILSFNVFLPFLLCAIGLGVVFGHFIILDVRVSFLMWLRSESKVPFWIQYYGSLWDSMLLSVKNKGMIAFQKKGVDKPKYVEGRLIATSIRKEKREIVMECGDSKDNYLVQLEDIEYLKIPEKAFKKHHERMDHIGQAFCCVAIAFGFFLLAYSAKLTGIFVEGKSALSSMVQFYEIIEYSLLIVALITLIISVMVSKKEFDNWRSYLEFCPDFGFLSIYLSLLFLLFFQKYPFDISTYIFFLASLLFFTVSADFLFLESDLCNTNYNKLKGNNDNSPPSRYYESNDPLLFYLFGMLFLYLSFLLNELINFASKISWASYLPFLLLLLIFIFYAYRLRPNIKNRVRKKLDSVLEEIESSLMPNAKEDNDPAWIDTIHDKTQLYQIMDELVHKMYLEMCLDNKAKSNFEYLDTTLIRTLSGNEMKVGHKLIESLKNIEKGYLRFEGPTILYLLHSIIKEKRRSILMEIKNEQFT